MRTSPTTAADPEWQKRLLKWGDKVATPGRRGADLAAVSAKLTALDPSDVPTYLQSQMPVVFDVFNEGSLWFFEVDPLLSHRMGLLRVLLALETIPDYLTSTKPHLPQVQTLQEHTFTGGTAFEALIDPLLLSIPPASLGFSWSWMPHGLVFLFGFPDLIIEEHPPTFASLYAPRLHGSGAGFHWRESAFFENQRLLRRNEMVPHLEAIWEEPIQLRQRFKAQTHHLYDRIYQHARNEAYDFRLTTNGIKV